MGAMRESRSVAVLREGADVLWDAIENVTEGQAAFAGISLQPEGARVALQTMSQWLITQADTVALLVDVGKFDAAEFEDVYTFVAQLPIDLDSQLVAGYLAGLTIAALVRLHRVKYHKVRSTLLANGVPLRSGQRRIPPSPPGLAAAYNQGATIALLAALHDLSYGMTRRMLIRDKVKLRPRGGS
jgi:hypothetical protein